MNDLEKKFKDRWPFLFQNVRCGFSLPRGWEDLVWELCEALEEQVGAEAILCDQVKEKFGGLRFYCHTIDNNYQEVSELIRAAEAKSFTICSRCGTNEDVTTEGPGWITTRCPSCRASLEKEKAERWANIK